MNHTTPLRLLRLALLACLLAVPLTACDDGGEEGNGPEDTASGDTTSGDTTADGDLVEETAEDTNTGDDDTGSEPDQVDLGDDTTPEPDQADVPPGDTTPEPDLVDVTDDTAGDVPDPQDTTPFEPGPFVDDCLAEPLPADVNQARQLLFTAPGLRLGIVRDVDPDAFGTSGTTIFRARRFALETASAQVCLTDTGLDYQISHHNFDDVFTAVDGDTRYVLAMHTEGFEQPFVDTLEAQAEPGGSTLWGPLTLTFEGCTPLDPQGFCQFGRRGE